MANKRRPHKVRPPYKRFVGTGLPGRTDVENESEPEADAEAELETDLEPESQSEHRQSTTGVRLPLEIRRLICSLCHKKYALLSVSRDWFEAALPFVYECPELGPTNFAAFVEAISSSRTLGGLVRELDLVKIAQTGKNSMTARLLRRCSPRLERFIAPQSHFGFSPVLSLQHCHRLRILDLGLVTETVDLPEVLKAVQGFQNLEGLNFPRSSIRCGEDYDLVWPPNLRSLGLAGGITSTFVANTSLPPSLQDLTISNCPYVSGDAVLAMLTRIGPQLQRLAVYYPMPLLGPASLDPVLLLCPNLTVFRTSVDYVTSDLLDSERIPVGHPLATLGLASSGMMGHAHKIRPGDVLLATEEALVHLKRVRTSFQLGWNPQSLTLAGLVETLHERGGGVWLE